MVKTLHNRIVSPAEWLNERENLLQREKALTRLRDQIAEERRALPWVLISKPYVFESKNGPVSLEDLFEGRSQLIVSHFMFGPDWEEGCVGCSFGADHVDGARIHLENHDVSYVAISKAPYSKIETFKKRMGWKFRWVSSFENDFNADFFVSWPKQEVENGKVFYNYKMQNVFREEMNGISVFYKDEDGLIYHTYSAFARGTEELAGTFIYLDLTPKGRNETGPGFNLTDWVKHHDKYESSHVNLFQANGKADSSCCH
ncbi:MAG: DUF899 domain-containing protein [Bacteroidetes bacterium]|nr:MAG: DUF899 domain-containing protein [Bacteroidota bacterium]